MVLEEGAELLEVFNPFSEGSWSIRASASPANIKVDSHLDIRDGSTM